MKPVTLWYRKLSKEQHLEFNHLADGHTTEPLPVGMNKAQSQQWKNGEWDFELAHLTDAGVVVHS